MTRHLDPDLAAALEVLVGLGPLQVLDVHPTPPERRPAPPPAPGPEPAQPGLFDPTAEPAPAGDHQPLQPPATTPALARGAAPRPHPIASEVP
jgi:hypothetical protein